MIKKRAFDLIYKKFKDDVKKFAEKKVDDAFAADDICQEVFRDFYIKMDQFDCTNLKGIRSWLIVAADLKVKEYLRKRTHETERVERAIEKEKNAEVVYERSPEDYYFEQVKNNKMKELFAKFIQKNPDDFDMLLKIKYEDNNPESVAEEYGISVGALYTRMSRIRFKLRQEFTELQV